MPITQAGISLGIIELKKIADLNKFVNKEAVIFALK